MTEIGRLCYYYRQTYGPVLKLFAGITNHKSDFVILVIVGGTKLSIRHFFTNMSACIESGHGCHFILLSVLDMILRDMLAIIDTFGR